MKTQVLWKSSVLQIVQASPSILVTELEKHFRRPWSQLATFGLSLNPPTGVNRSLEQIRADCTEPNGTVWGTRFFDVLPPGFLVSPTSKWVWESAEQVVPEFSTSAAVRGHHGFHAAWVQDLQNWVDSNVDHHTTKCKALVLGHGDIILGIEGWRSSKMTIVRAMVHEHINALRVRYPSIQFQETSNDFVSYVSFDFPTDIRKVEKWLRDQSLSKMKDEFA